MSSKWNDENEEIVVDEQPRQDGLTEEMIDQAERETASSGRDSEWPAGLDPVELLLRIEQQLTRTQEQEGLEEKVTASLADLSSRFDDLFARFEAISGRLDDLSEQIAEQPVPAPVEEEPELVEEPVVAESVPAAGPSGAWEELVLGTYLSQVSAIEADRQCLMQQVIAHEGTAVGLAARLMLVHAAGERELPSHLKEVGEAFYRWRPKTVDEPDAFEQALVDMLSQRISEAGLRNSIQLVHPGDRYDAARHVSSNRGVEVAEVKGWIVLRENGKPFTKATVSLR